MRGLGYRPSPPKGPGERPDFNASTKLRAGPVPASSDNRHLVLDVLDQGNLGCHDGSTEVLTEGGWVRWPEYDGKSLLGTVNQVTKLLEFQAPIAVQAYDYDGPIHRIDHVHLDYAVTPNHRMFVRPWVQSARTLSRDFMFKRADELGWYQGLLAAPLGHIGVKLGTVTIGDREYDGGDFLRLVSLIVSDGWTGSTANTIGRVSFCCFRADRIDMVRALAQRLGLHEQDGRPGVWCWTDHALARWLRANIYTGDVLRSPFKKLPDIVKSVSSEQIGDFLGFFGDQHQPDDSGTQFYSSSRRVIDDLQELLLRLGRRTGIYERPPRSTRMADGRAISADNCSADITLTAWTGDKLSIERKRQVRVDAYKGPVFCATVPNSTLITRRNGSVLVSGNSCVANAVMQAVRASQVKHGAVNPPLGSRLWTYYLARAMSNEQNEDNGTFIRNAFSAIVKLGFPPEYEMPYSDQGDAFRTPPSPDVVRAAYDQRQPTEYHRILTTGRARVDDVKRALRQEYLVCFGTSVSDRFCSNDLGFGSVPPPIRESIAGGHAMTIVGHIGNAFDVVNSWGTGWGDRGFWTMSADYLAWSETDDLWVCQAAPNFSEVA
jgi:hypothetical protein